MYKILHFKIIKISNFSTKQNLPTLEIYANKNDAQVKAASQNYLCITKSFNNKIAQAGMAYISKSRFQIQVKASIVTNNNNYKLYVLVPHLPLAYTDLILPTCYNSSSFYLYCAKNLHKNKNKNDQITAENHQ